MLAGAGARRSAAYAVAETFRWNHGLDLKPHQARGFYAIVALATAGGVLLNFIGIDPIRALVWAAVINGVAAVPIMAVMMLLATDRRVLGEFAVRRWLKQSNPGLSALLTQHLGHAWENDLEELERLRGAIDDAEFCAEMRRIKQVNKEHFADVVLRRVGVEISVDSLFDVQVQGKLQW
jgi:hypothetical protein